MTHCALYLRVSTDLQREKNTIESQRTLLPKIAASHNLTIYNTYIDDGISGESIEARPAFCDLLDDASAGYFNAVIVIDFDRLTRATDLTQLALIKKIFLDADIQVITPNQVFDFKNEDHDFMSDLFGILAKHEKRKILARTRRGIKEKMRQGKWIMGILPTPYYRNEEGKAVINPEKLKLVLAILKDSKTMGSPSISQEYALYQGQVRRMLSRKRLLFYAGFLDVDGENVRGSWPPIISLEEAMEILSFSNQRFNERVFPKYSYLLTAMGLFSCRCGRSVGSHTFTRVRRDKNKMNEPPRAYRRGYYRCNNRQCIYRSKVRSSDTIDAIVLRRLSFHLGRVDIIQEYVTKLNKADKSTQKIDLLKGRIKKEETKKKNLIRALSEGVLTFQDAKAELEGIKQKISSLETSLNALLGQSQGAIEEMTLKTMKNIMPQDLDFEGRRDTIHACIQKIALNEAYLFIFYRFPVDEKGRNKERIPLN